MRFLGFYVLIINNLYKVNPPQKTSYFYRGFHPSLLLDFQLVTPIKPYGCPPYSKSFSKNIFRTLRHGVAKFFSRTQIAQIKGILSLTLVIDISLRSRISVFLFFTFHSSLISGPLLLRSSFATSPLQVRSWDGRKMGLTWESQGTYLGGSSELLLQIFEIENHSTARASNCWQMTIPFLNPVFLNDVL